ncbi:neuropeptide SIFamide receptor [Oncorhynchus clarkii lewisi]|uniref:neuropeptide SIFamide receptor n=1 Tax=Oncorhynchus clarkii lewisi TaxID=490388 RepID=UPI0039B8A397
MDATEWIEAFIRGLMCLLGILGNNWLCLRSLPGPKSSLRTNELLFINLAVSNLITNYLVDLPDTMADFVGYWFLGEAYCCVVQFCSDLSETSSVFSTLFISVFWHQKLVGSLKRGGAPIQLDSLRLVACLLAGSWTVAVVFSVPQLFFVRLESGNESHDDCIELFPSQTARQTYEPLYLTFANALPITGIAFASIQIVITLLRHQARIQGLTSDHHKGTANSLPNNGPSPSPGSGTQVRAAKSVVAVATVFVVCWVTHLLLMMASNIHTSSLVLELASYIGSSYTCIIPYIFLYGVKKLSFSCRG